MESAELVYKVQQLSQAAGLAYNEHHPVECVALLVELRDFLIEQSLVTEKAETPPPAEETETEQSEQDTPAENIIPFPGPEAQPSEQ